MAWEKRGGKRYYTRSSKVNGKVHRTYLGCGPVAELAAVLDARRRQDRLDQWDVRKTYARCWLEASKPLEALDRATALLSEAALLVAGYHRHQSEWRRPRYPRLADPAEETNVEGDMTSDTKTSQSETVLLQELVTRARSGDRSVLPGLRQILDQHSDLWTRYGDLALQAQAAWIDLVCGEDLFLRESLQRKLAQLRDDLAVAGDALEGLLIDRVVACWLQLAYADATYAQVKEPASTAPLRRELQQRQESAHARYLSAIRHLALVRKLLQQNSARDTRTRTSLRLAAE